MCVRTCTQKEEVEDHVAFLITVPTALAIFFAIFVLVCIEAVFKKLLRLFSLVIWACLVAMGYLFMCFGGTISPWDQVSFFLFIIFVVYTMLPFNTRDAVVAGTLTSASHTITLSVCLSAKPEAREHLVWQILANVIIFICGNLAGAYHKHLMELALQQTYQDTCNCIKSRIKLEFEKRQQERLLLSLLPAHIAMEMKAEIIQRLQGPKAGQVENTNNFHNLYVKRHTNVRQHFGSRVGNHPLDTAATERRSLPATGLVSGAEVLHRNPYDVPMGQHNFQNRTLRTKSQKKRFEEELNERMIQAIDGINAQKQWLKSEDIQRISLLFYNKTLEKEYRATALPAFKYYVACACLIFGCIFLVQTLVLPKTTVLGVSFGVAFLLLTFILCVCFAGQLLFFLSDSEEAILPTANISNSSFPARSDHAAILRAQKLFFLP
ncbi:adenylate cyclase type 2-like, partial [Orycteropus afer afer]|uniref:Adenylate cyclase type 2-like n=1 Tax=Orycteropus afer afer TaxID=1230840 RepID=A0A8B7B2M0_ORYAF